MEELDKYFESGDIQELADLVEVVDDILDYKKVGIEDFNKIKENKRKSEGGFKKGLLLIEVIGDQE